MYGTRIPIYWSIHASVLVVLEVERIPRFLFYSFYFRFYLGYMVCHSCLRSRRDESYYDGIFFSLSYGVCILPVSVNPGDPATSVPGQIWKVKCLECNLICSYVGKGHRAPELSNSELF